MKRLLIVTFAFLIVGCGLDDDKQEALVQYANSSLDVLKKASDIYRMDKKMCPKSIAEMGYILKGPGRSFEESEIDPWGSPYVIDEHGGVCDFISYGRDKKPGGTGFDADLIK